MSEDGNGGGVPPEGEQGQRPHRVDADNAYVPPQPVKEKPRPSSPEQQKVQINADSGSRFAETQPGTPLSDLAPPPPVVPGSRAAQTQPGTALSPSQQPPPVVPGARTAQTQPGTALSPSQQPPPVPAAHVPPAQPQVAPAAPPRTLGHPGALTPGGAPPRTLGHPGALAPATPAAQSGPPPPRRPMPSPPIPAAAAQPAPVAIQQETAAAPIDAPAASSPPAASPSPVPAVEASDGAVAMANTGPAATPSDPSSSAATAGGAPNPDAHPLESTFSLWSQENRVDAELLPSAMAMSPAAPSVEAEQPVAPAAMQASASSRAGNRAAMTVGLAIAAIALLATVVYLAIRGSSVSDDPEAVKWSDDGRRLQPTAEPSVTAKATATAAQKPQWRGPARPRPKPKPREDIYEDD